MKSVNSSNSLLIDYRNTYGFRSYIILVLKVVLEMLMPPYLSIRLIADLVSLPTDAAISSSSS